MKKLVKDLKDNIIGKLYLFTGNEPYLLNMYEGIMTDKIFPDGDNGLNHDKFEGKAVKVEEIFQAVETLPFMSERRLISVKDSGLFATGKKAESALATELIKDLPDTATLIFIESNVDKRSAMYKALGKLGKIAEFNTPSEAELAAWVIRELKKGGVTADKDTVLYMLRNTGLDMANTLSEINKLTAYKNSGGGLTKEDIDYVCSKSLEARVFDLVGAIAGKNLKKAMDIFQTLMVLKESPIMALSLIARQFRLILQCGCLKGSSGEIAAMLEVRPFVVSECIKQSKNFSRQTLIEAINDCHQADINIKTGKMADKTALEILIVKYAN